MAISRPWAGSIAFGVLALTLAAGCGGGGGSGGSDGGGGVGGAIAGVSGSAGTGFAGLGLFREIVGSAVVAYQAGTTPGADATQIGKAVTDSNGSFAITFSPTPSTGAIVYLVATGGDAGRGSNNAISLMTVLGPYCQDVNCQFPANANINELTTVATAAAFQRFIAFVDCSKIAGNSQPGTCVDIRGNLALAGQSAALNALADVNSGKPSAFLKAQPTTSPVYSTLRKLNTLANLLGSCVDSDGSTSSPCGSLFSQIPWLVNPNTLQAAWEIASSPAATFNQSFFKVWAQQEFGIYSPVLSSPPSNWTIGGYSFAYVANNASDNVSGYTVDPANGALVPLSVPSFSAGDEPYAVAIDPAGKFLYVADFHGNKISGFAIDPATGTTTPIDGLPIGTGTHPASLAIDPTSRFLYAGNFQGNSISGYTINSATGALSPIAGSPFGANGYPAAVVIHPNGAFAYVPNFGGNSVSAFAINSSTGALSAISGSSFSAGTKPNSLAITPDGQFAYVANSGSNNVSGYHLDPSTGALSPVSGSPFPGGNTPFFITVAAGHAYVVNNKGNNVSSYTIDDSNGGLVGPTNFDTGSTPTSITADSTGSFVYVTNSNPSTNSGSVSAYAINPTSGALSQVKVGGSPFSNPDRPTGVAVDPRGKFLYASDLGTRKVTGGKVSAYTIDSLTGSLSEISGSPFAAFGDVLEAKFYQGTHVAIDPLNRFLYLKNKNPDTDSGYISEYSINLSSGSPTGVGFRFTGDVGADFMLISPSVAKLYAEGRPGKNKGGIATFAINASNGTLSEQGDLAITTDTNFGHYGVAVDPSGRALYAGDVFIGSSVLRVYAIDSSGVVTGEASGSPYSIDGLSPESVAVDALNDLLYVGSVDLNPLKSNKVWQFAFNPGDPKSLTRLDSRDCGSGPDAMAVVGKGGFFYIADNGNLVTAGTTVEGFSSDLARLPGSPYPAAARPDSVAVDASDRFVYVGSGYPVPGVDGNISAYTIGANGALAQIPAMNSPFATDNRPMWLAVSPGAYQFESLHAPTPTATTTPKPTAGVTSTPSATPRPTATATVRPTATSTERPTATPTKMPTSTPTGTPSATPTPKSGIVPVCEKTSGGVSRGLDRIIIDVCNGTAGYTYIASISYVFGATITPPSGWTRIAVSSASGKIAVATFWHRSSGSEPANYTWKCNGTCFPAGGIEAYSGIVRSGSPIDNLATNTGSDGPPEFIDSINTSIGHDYVVATCGDALTSNIAGGWSTGTRRWLVPYVSGMSLMNTYDDRPGPSTPSKTGKISFSGDISNPSKYWACQQIALRPKL